MPNLSDTSLQMYEELSSELRALNQAWRYVHDMTRERLVSDTFNRASAPFFGTVLTALFAYCMIILGRLLDHGETGKLENCSLAALPGGAGDAPLAQSLSRIRAGAAQLLQYRNKQIAHLDRVTTLDSADDQPQLFTWVGMHETLADLRAWMNAFESSVELRVACYDVGEDWGDADEVRDLLRKALRG